MPLIPLLRRQRQEDLREFEASLVYVGAARITEGDPISKRKEKFELAKIKIHVEDKNGKGYVPESSGPAETRASWGKADE